MSGLEEGRYFRGLSVQQWTVTLLWICAQSEKKQSLDQALRGRSKSCAEVAQEGAVLEGYQGHAPGGGATVCLSVWECWRDQDTGLISETHRVGLRSYTKGRA